MLGALSLDGHALAAAAVATNTRREPPQPTSSSSSSSSSHHYQRRGAAYCLHTDELEQRLLLAKEGEQAAFYERTGRVFAGLLGVAKQRIHATIVERRQQHQRQQDAANALRHNSISSSLRPLNGTRPTRIRLVASEQRFIAALHQQSKRELDEHWERTRDRTVAESFSTENHSQRQAHSPGDARLAQIRADFYDGFEPHPGQIALFEMLCEQLGARIYAEEWERDWRSICKRNRWYNRRLQLGFSSSIMPRRNGKTTVGARSGLAFAMNIPRWKGVIIGTSLETAAYTIEEMEKQFYACARGVRDFKFVKTSVGIALAPKNNLLDVRTWIIIPGEVRRACEVHPALLCFACTMGVGTPSFFLSRLLSFSQTLPSCVCVGLCTMSSSVCMVIP